MSEETTQKALEAYQKLHPGFEFPPDFPEEDKLSAIQKSRGRLIIFSRQDGKYQLFFEDIDEPLMEIPSWNRIIGCGG